MIDTIDERVTAMKWNFVPVIFANGEDDDLPGLTAALQNERVQYDDHIFEPDEAITISHRQMRLVASVVTFVGEDEEVLRLPPAPARGVGGEDIVVHLHLHSRSVHMNHCNIRMGA